MFLRKFIIGTVAVATLGASAAVFADNNSNPSNDTANFNKDSGVYLRGQLGYGFAGSDVSGQVLAGSTPVPVLIDNNKSDGITGRVAVGYDFNKYFALESGYSLLSSFNSTFTGSNSFLIGGTSYSSANVKSSLWTVDLMGKAMLPLNKLFVFVEGGGAYVHANNSALSTVASNGTLGTQTVTILPANSNGVIEPKAGAGLGYNFTNHIGVDVSYDRIFATSGNSGIAIPSINTVMGGLTYKF
jgi:opacity protein-like surface antigen